MSDRFFGEIGLLRRRWDLLRHPFYRRWSAGDLSRRDLRLYAGQYHHAVVAIAEASERAAVQASGEPFASELAEHAAEEREHIELWLGFARATGWESGEIGSEAAGPLPETDECAGVWIGEPDRDLDRHLVTLYAVEVAQPAVSRTKLDGLRRHYRITNPRATGYFRVHAAWDDEHAALARRVLAPRIPDADRAELLDLAEAAYRANWRLLDGVERRVDR